MVATPVFVHIEDALVTVAATGAALAVLCAAAGAIALGLRATGIGGTLAISWLAGVLLSVVSIAVQTWWPLALAVGGAVIAVALGAVAHLARTFVLRPRYRRTGVITGP